MFRFAQQDICGNSYSTLMVQCHATTYTLRHSLSASALPILLGSASDNIDGRPPLPLSTGTQTFPTRRSHFSLGQNRNHGPKAGNVMADDAGANPTSNSWGERAAARLSLVMEVGPTASKCWTHSSMRNRSSINQLVHEAKQCQCLLTWPDQKSPWQDCQPSQSDHEPTNADACQACFPAQPTIRTPIVAVGSWPERLGSSSHLPHSNICQVDGLSEACRYTDWRCSLRPTRLIRGVVVG